MSKLDLASIGKTKNIILISTLSIHVVTLKLALDMMMLLAQDPIEKLALISIKFFEATYITKIQNLKNMHGQ